MPKCDLCGQPCEDADHAAVSHSGLLLFIAAQQKQRPALLRRLRDGTVPNDAPVDALGSSARRIAHAADGGPDAFGVACRFVAQLEDLLEGLHPGSRLRPFGSVMSLGTWNGAGDIDLTLVDADAVDRGEWPPGGNAVALMEAAYTRLVNNGPFSKSHLTAVLHTRVPVVRHKCRATPSPVGSASAMHPFAVDFDISCGVNGIRNTALIRAYMQQSMLVRAGSVFIKTWSKRCGVNNPSKGFLTSYAVNVLWIYFLLRQGEVRFVDPAAFAGKLPEPPSCHDDFTALYMSMRPEEEDVPAFDQLLGDLLHRFFVYYASQFDWWTQVVTLLEEAPVTKAQRGWTAAKEVRDAELKDRVWYRACIEDPFEKNLNLGRHLSDVKTRTVISEFAYAADCIQRGDDHLLLRDRTAVTAAELERRLMEAVLRVLDERDGAGGFSRHDVIAELSVPELADLAAYEALHPPLPVFAAIDYQRRNPSFDLFTFLKDQLLRLAPATRQSESDDGLRYWASRLLGTYTSAAPCIPQEVALRLIKLRPVAAALDALIKHPRVAAAPNAPLPDDDLGDDEVAPLPSSRRKLQC